MSAKELINELKKITKNIDYTTDYEDEDSIVIYYAQKYFSIYGCVEFDKDTLKSVNRDGYLKMIAKDIANVISKKCFLEENK